jgi:membrane protein
MRFQELAELPGRIASRSESLLTRRYLGRIAVGVGRQLRADHIGIVAAGAAFYAFLAVLPALAALVLIYGLVFDTTDVVGHVELLSRVAPAEATQLLQGELQRLVDSDLPSLGIGLAGSALVALWSSTKGARALIEGLNIVEGETECRGVAALYGLSIAFTACGLLLVLLVLAVVLALPVVAEWLPGPLALLIPLVRFLILPLTALISIGALYRFGSCAARPRSWLSAGAAVAAALWLLSSWLFQLYVAEIARYSATFGSVSTVVVFMLWLYLSCLAILVGAEVDVVVRADGQAAAGAGP